MKSVNGINATLLQYTVVSVLIFLFFFSQSIYSQNLDSLWSIWNDEQKPDSSRMEAMQIISWKTATRINYDSGFVYANQLLDFARKKNKPAVEAVALKTMGLANYLSGNIELGLDYYNKGLQKAIIANDSDQMGRIYNNIGNTHKALGNYDLSLEAHQKSMNIKKLRGDRVGLSYSYNNIGVLYSEQDNLPMALKHFHENLMICAELGLKVNVAQASQNIGIVYIQQKKYREALGYLQRAEEPFVELNLKRGLSSIYNNMGVVYYNFDDPDLALVYYEKALKIGRETKDKILISDVFRNLGNIYYQKDDFSKAMDNYQKSLDIKIELGDKQDIAAANIDIGSLYLDLGQPNQSKKWCTNAYKQAIEFNYLEELMQSSKCLKKTYLKLGDIQQAYNFQEEYYDLRDSLRILQNKDEVNRLAMQYQFDKQYLADSLAMAIEQQNLELVYQSNIDNERNQRNVITIISFTILIIAGILYGWLIFVRRNNRKLAEKNLIIEREKNRAEESERAKEVFFSNISHELRTPLTLIIGPLDYLIENTEDQNIKRELTIVQRSASRLHSMINELLDLYKLESGKITLNVSSIEIVSVISQLVQSFESLATQNKLKLNFIHNTNDCIAFVDLDKLEKVLINLLSNAFKFTNGPGEITINLECENNEKDLRISVADTGIGIPNDKIDHVFDRFYQVDESYSRGYEGTGIGLSLTKELVELHNGKIWAESELEKGSVFTILIPKGDEEQKTNENQLDDFENIDLEVDSDNKALAYLADDDRPETEKEKEVSTALPIVLIVEDNRDMRKYIRSCLDERLYKFAEAKDGEEGLKKAIEKVPDLIVSDVMMPKMDGNEMCRRVKMDEYTSHIPVLLVTARASVEQKIKGIETGADAYVSKPFNAKELQVWVKKLIEQRTKLRQSFMRNFKPGFQLTSEKITNIDQQFIQKAVGMVEKYISDPDFSVEKFGQEMAMSRVQLHRKLKALTDQSASQFVRTIRLTKVAEHLAVSQGNIKETAYQFGFNNLSYLDKCFKKQFGMTPSEYIANHKS